MKLALRDFDPSFATTIASWVPTEKDLLWLAPRTPPPVTPEKILDWARAAKAVRMLFAASEPTPCGYGEISPAKDQPTHLWLGHVIIDPARRGGGLGSRFVDLLLKESFETKAAASVALVVFPGNQPAVRCYLSSGFLRRREEFHRFRPGGAKHRMLRMDISRKDWELRRLRNSDAHPVHPDRQNLPKV